MIIYNSFTAKLIEAIHQNAKPNWPETAYLSLKPTLIRVRFFSMQDQDNKDNSSLCMTKCIESAYLHIRLNWLRTKLIKIAHHTVWSSWWGQLSPSKTLFRSRNFGYVLAPDLQLKNISVSPTALQKAFKAYDKSNFKFCTITAGADSNFRKPRADPKRVRGSSRLL